MDAATTDLPIDIGIISQTGTGRRDALTARRGLDMFSEASAAAGAALSEQARSRREEAARELFATARVDRAVDVDARTSLAAADAGLFLAPAGHGLAGAAATEGIPVPLPLAAVLFAPCGLAGFRAAQQGTPVPAGRRHGRRPRAGDGEQ